MNNSEHLGNITERYEDISIPESMFRMWGITSVITSLVGIPGNALVILSICLNKHLRTAPNFLVLNLSVCDLLFLSLVVPYQACGFLTAKPCVPQLCWVAGFLANSLLASSILNTASIALNRYITIVLQSGQRAISNTKTIIAMCIGVYLIPVVIISPIFFDKKLGTFLFEEHLRQCGWNSRSVIRAVIIIGIVISPLIFMTACYIRILMFVIASRKRVSSLGSAGPGTQRPTETRLSQMLAMVYLVYLLTTFPSLVVNIVKGTGVFVSSSLTTSVFLLVWTSSAINPIVYGLVNKKYREAYKSVLMKIPVPFRTTETVETNTG